MSQINDNQRQNEDEHVPPVIEFDTPDQPNSWVAELARQREGAKTVSPQPPTKEQPNGRQPQQ